MRQAQQNSKDGKGIKQRIEPYTPEKNMSNVIFCWGCVPSKGVNADTRMVHDFNDTLEARFSKKTLTLEFPQILDNMLGAPDDCKWEFWKSNQIQTCRLQYCHNLTTEKDQGKVRTRGRGIIIINSVLKNQHSGLEGEDRKNKFKEIWVK